MDKGYINLDIREENLIILTVLSRFEQYHTLLKCLTMIAGTRWQELFLASG